MNLIGEHTDYNGGFVLPMALPQRTHVELTPRADGFVRAWSDGAPPGQRHAEFTLGTERSGRGWVDYIQGVTATLRRDGHQFLGFELRARSDVPPGSGVASSAALTVALLRAMREAWRLDLDDVQLALVAQRAENEFVGARVGVMDPLVASLGDDQAALFVDTRSLAYERVPLPAGAELAVIHSGLPHRHATGEYNARRAQCEDACELLGVAQLRDLTAADLPRLAGLPDRISRRARHVVTENARVLAAVDAMRAGNLGRLGQLFDESHRSMRDDYEVSTPEIDLLVELAWAQPGVYGARLTGGGFGGSIVVIAARGSGQTVADRIVANYLARTSHAARILMPTAPSPSSSAPP